MFSRLIIRLLYAGLLLIIPARADEVNFWPFYVRGDAEGSGTASSQWLGPLFFTQVGPTESGPTTTFGLRPLYSKSQTSNLAQGTALYPFFVWRQQDEFRSFSFFQIVNSVSDGVDAAHPNKRFNVWPVYFSRTATDPADSYRALFPLGGEIKNRFGKDRLNFILWPLYVHTEKNGRQITHAPWPFLRFIGGEDYHGFEFWPFFGRSAHPGDYDRQFYFWPLGYKSSTNLAEPIPDVALGVLPFYARDTGPGYIRETYAWPFFGYTHRTAPFRYDEQRYFWPLLVQGRGDDRLINRWAPFYTHSVIKGTDKTWLLWPLYRNQRWSADGVAQQKDQVLLFLYWSLRQHSLAHPAARPAHKTHLWPVFSAWDNGAGHKQFQALSPFEVFFPGNEAVRHLWTPLFALYRYDRQPDASVRHSLLWNALTYRRSPTAKEFHLGPLFSVHADPSRRRIALGNGLIGLRRNADERWRLFLFDFKSKPAIKANPVTPP